MHPPKEFDVEELRKYFLYDPQTGSIVWKVSSKNGVRKKGKEAGCISSGGYRIITLHKRIYQSHRIAWALYYGYCPMFIIDHDDGDPSNNAISNLRKADVQKNGANRKIGKNNKTGFKGVCKNKYGYQSSIRVHGKSIYLGTFETPEEAHAAYCAASKKYFGEFARTE